MRVLVLGSSGQVGSELRRAKWAPGTHLISLDRSAADFSEPAQLYPIVRDARPDAVVIAAAYTAVDLAETDEVRAATINAEAPGTIARAAAELSAPVLHFSTDYVFDGEKDGAYTEDDDTAPINAYGRTKLAGEAAIREANPRHLMLRTSWVYSAQDANFLRTMLKLAESRGRIDVVADQHGCPTAAADIAQTVARVLPEVVRNDGPWGTYHLAGSTATSWHGFAEAIFHEAAAQGSKRPQVNAIKTADYPTAARRPRNSRLSSELFAETFGIRLPGFRESMPRVLGELLSQDLGAAQQVRG